MIRTVITPNTQTVSFDIPKDYVGKEVEVIAFAINEGLAEKSGLKKQATFSAISLNTKGVKFNRDEANER